jgi:hypothetical protein
MEKQYPRSVDNKLIIKPVIYDPKEQETTTYTRTKRLDANLVQLYNKTLSCTEDGEISANILFENDFKLSQNFGKYNAREIVSAKNKTLMEVFKEAFCENLLPGRISNPAIYYTIWDPEQSDLTYEIGTTRKLNWKVEFFPGEYSYGTLAGNKSNLYVNKLTFEVPEGSHITEVTANLSTALAELNGTITVDPGNPFVFRYQNSEGTYSHFPTNNKIPGKLEIANGTITYALTDSVPTNYESSLKASCYIDEKDPAVTALGDSTALVTFRSYFAENATELILPKATAGAASTKYRWFCGYKTIDDAIEITNDPTNPIEFARKLFNSDLSELGGFPDVIETNQAVQWLFAAPKANDKTATLLLTNAITEASASLNYNSCPVRIKDASENAYLDYTLFYITNDGADRGTNKYKITYNETNTSQEGGTST